MTTDIEREIVGRLAIAIALKKLTPRAVAQRSGLHPRTVRRILSGATFSLDTVRAIAQALHVPLTLDTPSSPSDPSSAIASHLAPLPSLPPDPPVVGWKRAAALLGISRGTLRRAVVAAGQPQRRAWWSSRAALHRWFEDIAVTGW
jgi:transcriptional regulator with XRE-family HTH domain